MTETSFNLENNFGWTILSFRPKHRDCGEAAQQLEGGSWGQGAQQEETSGEHWDIELIVKNHVDTYVLPC